MLWLVAGLLFMLVVIGYRAYPPEMSRRMWLDQMLAVVTGMMIGAMLMYLWLDKQR